MSINPKAPGFTILAGIGLSVLILLAWVGQLATLSDLSGTDPAGNALAQAFGALEIIVLWGLLAVLALLAATKGAMPRAAALAITILIPASGFAAMTAAEHPARFSMLTQQASLKAWLSFADDEGLREQALAGARKLDHRTSDAVEMLGEDEYTAQTMLRYLPVLDLDATPQLCEAAQRVLDRQFAQIYRPKADDPRPYRELLSRLGGDARFSALRWLAEHGCAVESELSDAESVVRAYQDSPERAAMLATLAQLRRKP